MIGSAGGLLDCRVIGTSFSGGMAGLETDCDVVQGIISAPLLYPCQPNRYSVGAPVLDDSVG